MSLIEHAKKELDLLGYNDGDDMNTAMRNDVLELIEVFARQHHSGFSAPWAIGLFSTLANFEPLGPLTGKDAEWNEVEAGRDDERLFQNKRCSHVFKDGHGQAYDINGKVFIDKSGCSYTSRDSRVNITFPYTPVTEYVNTNE